MKASHKEIWIPVRTGIGFTQVQILPGQFIFGRHEAAKELKMRPGSVRNRMEKLKNIGNLDIKPDKHFSLISIINWDSYQSYINEVDNQVDNHRTTTGQPQDTNKNVKNDKNVKNKGIDVLVSKKKPKTSYPTDNEFILSLKDLYSYVDINQELNKMKAWLMTPKGMGRQLNRRFIVNWLNKLERPISTGEVAPINEQDRKSWEIKKALDNIKWKEKDEDEYSKPT